MSYQPATTSLPAPCLVDTGTIINKKDMVRLLKHLRRVRYVHGHAEKILKEGEGCIVEIFSDPQQATLVANSSLYINVNSFDYMEMGQLQDKQPFFDLIQDSYYLRLMPLSNPLKDRAACNMSDATLEAMLAEALTARWDACLDDDSNNFSA